MNIKKEVLNGLIISIIMISFNVVIALFSCTKVNHNLVSSKFLDSIYFNNAKELDGLGSFIIDKSTYDSTLNLIRKEIYDVINDTIIDIDSYASSLLTKEVAYKEDYYFYSDRWIGTPYYMGTIDIGSKENNGLKYITMQDYYYNNIDLKYLKLTFLKDTLFSIECGDNVELTNDFIQKYKNPRINVKNTWGDIVKDPKIDSLSEDSIIVDTRTIFNWENKNVITRLYTYESYNHNDLNIKEKRKTYRDLINWNHFLIESKNTKRNNEIRKINRR
jgi:hypothetical protein